MPNRLTNILNSYSDYLHNKMVPVLVNILNNDYEGHTGTFESERYNKI